MKYGTEYLKDCSNHYIYSHFISTVIVVGIAMSLVSYDGAINELRGLFG